MTSCIVGKKIFYSHTFMHYKCDMKIGAQGPGLLELYPFVIFHYFDMHLFSVKDISGNTYLQTSTFVHMTSITSCIVENKINGNRARSLRVISLYCSYY